MAVSAELQKQVEDMAKTLSKADYRRASMSMNKFIGEQSSLLAQADVDQAALIAAGMDYSQMPLFRAQFEMLTLAFGDRLALVEVAPEKRVKYDELMAMANKDRKRLGVVGAHVVEQSKDRAALRNYRKIAKGSGEVDTLTDILGLVALVKEYPTHADAIKPGGTPLDTKYMADAMGRATELLGMRGIVVVKGVPQNAVVDRQNRLLTLCLNAQSYIKKFAAAAFFDNMDYYNAHYASASPSPSTRSSEVEVAAAETQPAEAAAAAK
jgi:hypothetical protein